MANIQKRKNKHGEVISYRIKVYKFTDEKGIKHFYEKTFKPEDNWSVQKTQKELNKAVVLFEAECKNGIVADNKLIFKNYATYVISLKNRTGVKHSTIELYNRLLVRINNEIGHIKLADLKPHHLNEFYEKLTGTGLNKNTGKKLSDKTILEHHRVIHTILKQAVKESYIPYNIADRAEPPRTKKKEAKHYELDEIIQILHFIEQEPLKWQVVFNLLIYTGCRRGEILGLMWDRVDFANKTIKIDNNILYSAQRGIYNDTPKTEQSSRLVSIPIEVIEILKQHKAEQNKMRLECGSKWNNTNYVLTQENGMPMHPDSITKYCKKFTEKYNKILEKENKKLIPHINPHAFRHTQASLLMACSDKNELIGISRRLGHAKVSTTSDIYSHLLQGKDEELCNSLSELITKHKKLQNISA